jgi:integrase/recombinase XerD
MTLVEAQNIFLELLSARGHSVHTVKLRRHYMMEFVAFLKSRSVHSVDEVTRGMVEEYRIWVMGRTHMYTGRKLSVSTLGHFFEPVKMFFGYLIQRKVLVMDPSGGLVWPKFRATFPKNIPTEEEMEQILFRPDIGTLTGMRDRAILELIYSTGLRREETANLDIYDVNLPERTVTVRRGKGGKGRVLPVGKSAIEFLTRYINETRPKMMNPLKQGEASQQTPALFVIPGGVRLSRGALGSTVSRYVRSVKPTVTLGCHAIRHAFATHMLRGGADIGMIQRMLGHVQVSTTEIYTHVAPIDLKREHRKCHPRGQLAPGDTSEGRSHENP